MKFTEKLPRTRTFEFRTMEWTPCDAAIPCPCSGVAELILRKTPGGKVYTKTYKVTEFRPDRGFEGRAARFEKPDGTAYHALLAANANHLCDCGGREYEATAKADHREGVRYSDSLGCCHLDALRALVENRWLPHPQNDPRPEAEYTEADIDAAVSQAVADRIGGFDICEDCGQLGTFVDELTGERVCVLCPASVPDEEAMMVGG